MTIRRTALVVGAHGVIGTTLMEHLASLPDWDVIGVSRRGGQDSGTVRHVAVDLLDADASATVLGTLTEVTHVFFAAFQDRPTWSELVAPNVAMLVNTVEAVAAAAPGLEHVSLMQGYKVYGAHLGPFQTPAREDDPGHLPPEFNLDQQHYLEGRSAGQPWSWSALRPSVVCGTALGNPMNLLAVITVYAAMSKALGVPLRFPGKPGAYDTLLELTDAGLLARATVWAATEPACAGQAFNITNGDLFRWNTMWPVLAELLDIPVGAPLPMSLTDVMGDKATTWEQIVAEHDLLPTPFADVSSWQFGDAVFSWDYDFLADSSKARRFGFAEHVETRVMFADLIADLRQRRIIP
ncbi:SDR family oxidoreductase [Sanguibacter sp. 25GB23B1]|uniref:SDR family oxidoreductase n=1 Tax=unclassified Sanguibacter TaxID=2645534 RepID=UPI0032AF284F